MGSLVETQIRNAIEALVNRDTELALEVIDGDARSTRSSASDRRLAMTIATQAPVARDLRFLLALHHVGLRAGADRGPRVERREAGRAASRRALAAAIGAVGRMGGLAADQVRGVLEAVVDVDQARRPRGRDRRRRDRPSLPRRLRRRRADHDRRSHRDRPRHAAILIAHWIERIGDRVTNIAEDVVYLASGEVEDLN